jgi:hypothetical protein
VCKIFLLSIDEVVRFFGDSGEIQYDYARIAQDANGTAIAWWLRSPGRVEAMASLVTSEGAIAVAGGGIGSSGVRPALWLNLYS